MITSNVVLTSNMRLKLFRFVKTVLLLTFLAFCLALFNAVILENVGIAKLSPSHEDKQGLGVDTPNGVRVIKRSLMQNKSDKQVAKLNAVDPNVKKSENITEDHDNAAKTGIEDIFISVKTTAKFHKDRVKLILDTWWTFAKDQVRTLWILPAICGFKVPNSP